MVTILSQTTKNPISLIGELAGICWNSDISDPDKNYKRGIDCIESDHGRTFEFPDVYMMIEDYSARVIREYMRHVGGGLTVLQESTRYVNCDKFRYYIPAKIKNDVKKSIVYADVMNKISAGYKELIEIGVSKEDAANVLPLGMMTKLVEKRNLRNLADMSHKRLCKRALPEFNTLMLEIMYRLSNYSDEWCTVVNLLFKPQCEILGYCPEKKGCGKYGKKNKGL